MGFNETDREQLNAMSKTLGSLYFLVQSATIWYYFFSSDSEVQCACNCTGI